MSKLSRHSIKYLFALLLLTIFSIAAASPPDLGPPQPGPAPEFPSQPDQLSDLTAASYFPLVSSEPEFAPWPNIQDRAAAKQFYLDSYGPENIDDGWTGSHESCQPGTVSLPYLGAILTRINYFRGAAGLPAVTGFKGEYNQQAQAAALMMSVNQKLSHSPGTDWKCYSEDGRVGAGSSNLYLGRSGPGAITGYIYDAGSNNYPVGHRRWILYPQTQYMGVGDIPSAGGYPQTNALYVFDRDNMWGERPATRDYYVAWPPPGYVPYMLGFPRWSFSYPNADFSASSVTMTKDGSPIGGALQSVRNGYGENTLVWEPAENTSSKPSLDTVYQVTVHNVVVNGQAESFEYEVILFDPAN